MDKLISNCLNSATSENLSFCNEYGVAFQTDMSHSVVYDEAYFEKYRGYRDGHRYGEVESLRANLAIATHCYHLIDIGVGCGSFLEYMSGISGSIKLHGFDINSTAEKWLKSKYWWINPYSENLPTTSTVWTMWDVLEHIPEPHLLLDKIKIGDFLIVSLPIYNRVEEVFGSHHYRPNEHYYYFTHWGFIKWITEYGFTVVEYNKNETHPSIGREGIGTFVCKRTRK